MNQRVINKLNTVIVNTYKTMGTVLLGIILVSLVTYLSVQAFFLLSLRWVAPTIVSPTDPNILQLNAQAAQQAAARDKLQSERRDVQARLEEAARIIEAEETFQQRFRAALADERKAQEASLHRLAQLRKQYQHSSREIAEANRAFAALTHGRTEALYGARLVDHEERLTTRHHLAQMAQSHLMLSQSAVELDSRVRALEREVRGLEAARAAMEGPDTRSRTPDVLLLEREYTRSTLERARAETLQEALREDLRSLDAAIARYEQLLATIQSSPYLRTIAGNLTVAFVPYENLGNAAEGTPLYACAAKVVWCRRVGEVGKVLEGEVSVKHPIRQHFLRGVMVEVQLQEGGSAYEQLLHLGRPPLLF